MARRPITGNELREVLAFLGHDTIPQPSLDAAARAINALGAVPITVVGNDERTCTGRRGRAHAIISRRCASVLAVLADGHWHDWRDLTRKGTRTATAGQSARAFGTVRKAVSRLRESLQVLDEDGKFWIHVDDGRYRWAPEAPPLDLTEV